MNTLDNESVNAIRFLSIDAIQKANSGHPGLPLDAAPMMYILWTRHLKQNPKDSHWFNRDRFILSAGHGSAMLYSLLHLAGYDVSLNDLQSFRKYKSKTPGHPEYRVVDGVDCTTGPLGQGFGMAVGMAITENHLAALYNEPNYPIIDHYTFVLASDGDLMEGISHEAASLAGHQQLGKLIVLYDSNNISLDGTTKNTFTENEKQRFEAYGWQYLLVNDGNDLDSLDKAIMQAKNNSTQPTIIEVKTVIGYGSPKANTNVVHGAPIGQADMIETRKFYNWAYEPFVIPNEIYENYKNKIAVPGLKEEKHWLELLKQYSQQFPQKYKTLQKGMHNVLTNTWQKDFPASQIGESESGRATSQ
ncbi:MAG: transketolase, partial [Bombilactobacillus sp.]